MGNRVKIDADNVSMVCSPNPFFNETAALRCNATQQVNYNGTIPILRQQRDWVGGIRKLTIFADVQYYLC